MKLKDALWALTSMFSPSREKKRQDGTDAAPISSTVTDAGYYEEVSSRYTSLQVIAIMVLAVFVSVSLMTDAELLTADRLVYFAKDMATSLSLREGAASETLVYTADEENHFTLYRGGLSVLSPTKLTVFTATGRESFTSSQTYHTPRANASGQYLLTYDIGGKSYGVCNSFTCVKTETLEHAIRSVAVSDAGSYCLVTDGEEYASEVLLYNENFRMINRYRLPEYTLFAAIRPDGGELAMASVTSDGGRLLTQIRVATPGKNEIDAVWNVPDVYPVDCRYANGNIRLLTTGGMFVFSSDGKEIGEFRADADEVLGFYPTADGYILRRPVNSFSNGSELLVLNGKAEVVCLVSGSFSIVDACFDGDTLYVLTDGEVYLFTERGIPAGSIPLSGNYRKIIPLPGDDTELLLCGDARSVRVSVRAATVPVEK